VLRRLPPLGALQRPAPSSATAAADMGLTDAPHIGDGWELRGGIVVDARDAFLADWIADTKRKQHSLPHDLTLSVERWEDRTGQTWTGQVPAVGRGVFPWEKAGVFQHLDDSLDRIEDQSPFRPDGQQRRRLLDTFGDSLKHVNRLYNKRFGYTARKVIAHMPHFMRKSVLQRLAAEFPDEWEATASHKLRSGTDMQYAFAYMYVAMASIAYRH